LAARCGLRLGDQGPRNRAMLAAGSKQESGFARIGAT